MCKKLKKPKSDNLVDLAQYYKHREQILGRILLIGFVLFFVFICSLCFVKYLFS